MKKAFIISGAVALILFSACQKEDAASGTNSDKQMVSANLTLDAVLESAAEEGTKTTIGVISDKRYAVWSEGDAVRVFDENGEYAKMDIARIDPAFPANATFFAKEVPAEFGTPACAIYPENFNSQYEDGVISFNLPATQSWEENSFADNTNVAVSKIEEEDGKLKAMFMNVCGYLKLQIKGNFKVSKITVSGHNEEKLNGSFNVDTEDFTVTSNGATTDTEKTLTLDCGDGVMLSSEQPTSFIFAVPVGAFGRGFVARIYGEGEDAAKFTLLTPTKDNSIKRSKIKAMGEKQFNEDTPKFVEVEYLQSTNGREQIIFTNYNAKKTVGIFVDFILDNTDHVQSIMGSFTDGCKLSVVKSTDEQNHFNLYFGNDEVQTRVFGAFSERHSIKIENNYGYIDNGKGKKINSGTINISGEKPLYLFCNPSFIGKTSGNRGLIGKVYSAYITDGGVKVRDFIPCCCISGKYTNGDGELSEAVTTDKPGMLDLVSGMLFINNHGVSGTDFTPGNYVPVE